MTSKCMLWSNVRYLNVKMFKAWLWICFIASTLYLLSCQVVCIKNINENE